MIKLNVKKAGNAHILAKQQPRSAETITRIWQGEHCEENISTKQYKTKTHPWFSGTHEHQGRPGSFETAPQKRP